MARLVAEDGAVDAVLPAVVDEDSPHEESVSTLGSENDLLAWSDELVPVPGASVGVAVSRVMALVQLDAVEVAVFGEPPERRISGHVRRS